MQQKRWNQIESAWNGTTFMRSLQMFTPRPIITHARYFFRRRDSARLSWPERAVLIGLPALAGIGTWVLSAGSGVALAAATVGLLLGLLAAISCVVLQLGRMALEQSDVHRGRRDAARMVSYSMAGAIYTSTVAATAAVLAAIASLIGATGRILDGIMAATLVHLLTCTFMLGRSTLSSVTNGAFQRDFYADPDPD